MNYKKLFLFSFLSVLGGFSALNAMDPDAIHSDNSSDSYYPERQVIVHNCTGRACKVLLVVSCVNKETRPPQQRPKSPFSAEEEFEIEQIKSSSRLQNGELLTLEIPYVHLAYVHQIAINDHFMGGISFDNYMNPVRKTKKYILPRFGTKKYYLTIEGIKTSHG